MKIKSIVKSNNENCEATRSGTQFLEIKHKKVQVCHIYIYIYTVLYVVPMKLVGCVARSVETNNKIMMKLITYQHSPCCAECLTFIVVSGSVQETLCHQDVIGMQF